MSDSYQLLIDHSATPDDAAIIAEIARRALVEEGLVHGVPSAECVLTGVGYPPGNRLREIYAYGEHELRYWEMLKTIGVKIITDRYINFFAFPIFEHSECPACGTRFPANHLVMDRVYETVAAFINDDRVDSITCPACSRPIPCNLWQTVPDVGVCHLAIEFWNWPPFDARGWRLSVPALLSQRMGRELAVSWGRL